METFYSQLLESSPAEIAELTQGKFGNLTATIFIQVLQGRPMAAVAKDYLKPLSEIKRTYEVCLHSLKCLAQAHVFEAERHEIPTIEVTSTLETVRRALIQKESLLYTLPPMKFEELIADLLRERGYDVHFTRASGDSGRDLLAYIRLPTGHPLLTIVECKRHSPDRALNPREVRAFLAVMNDHDKAPMGILATTTHFGPESRQIEKRNEHRLFLEDADSIRDWISGKGRWKKNPSSELWTPS